MQGKKALLRVDINVPVKNGWINPRNFRLKACADSVATYMKAGIIPIILSHQGRQDDDDYMEGLEQHAAALQKMLPDVNVIYSDSLDDQRTINRAAKLAQGDVLVLKNVRSHEDEKKKYTSAAQMQESNLIKVLSKCADIFISDTPATLHRPDLSLTGFQGVMESYIGIQTEREMKILEEIKQKLMSGKKTTIIFGGRKWEKLEHIYEIAGNKNVKVLCGGIPGESVCYMLDQSSLNPENQEIVKKIGSLDIVSKLVSEFKERISYPSDFVLDTKENVTVAELRNKKGIIMDIGDATLEKFFKEIQDSDMILYAGPVGRYEKGYHQSARLLNRIMSIKVPNYTLGGSSAESIDDYGVEKMFDTLQGVRVTSGGAALAFLAGTELPVLKAFSNLQ